jgi:acetyltransferase
MIEQGPLVEALRARRGGEPPEFDALERFLLRLSRLAVEQPWVREVAIDSLLVWERQVLARGVRVALHDQGAEEGPPSRPVAVPRRLPGEATLAATP